MAITRITEAHAEASDFEVIMMGSFIDRSNTKANNGAYSWRYSIVSGYMALPFYDATAGRTSMFLYMDAHVIGDVSLIKFKQSLTANMGVEVRIMEDEQTIRLYIDGVQQDEDTWANIGWETLTWMRISVTASSTQNYATVYLNDSAILTYSGAIANAPWDSVRYGERVEANGFGQYTYMDDIYVDSMGSESDALPPSYGFVPSYSDDDGDHLDFTPLAGQNFQMVDDGAVDDGDTTYNATASSAGAPKDSLETADISLPLNYVISAAIPWAVVKKMNAADDAQLILTSYDNGAAALKEGSGQAVPITYGYRRDRFTTQPDSSTWNEADFNAMQFGYKAGGSF
jgi:hypothetical protein